MITWLPLPLPLHVGLKLIALLAVADFCWEIVRGLYVKRDKLAHAQVTLMCFLLFLLVYALLYSQAVPW